MKGSASPRPQSAGAAPAGTIHDDEVNKADGTYHKFQLQPNAGKVPSSIKQWRDVNGGTHAVMATSYVKKDGTKEDVEKALKDAAESVKS